MQNRSAVPMNHQMRVALTELKVGQKTSSKGLEYNHKRRWETQIAAIFCVALRFSCRFRRSYIGHYGAAGCNHSSFITLRSQYHSLLLGHCMTRLQSYKVTWIIVQVIYNIYWHALSRFPGPWLYATSRVPYVLSAITGNLSMKLHELHEVYGPVVRTASNELSFIEPSAWKTIYGQSESGYTNYKKNYDTFNETRNQIGQSIFIAGDEDHKRMRKILNYAFSPHSLQQLEPLLLENASELLQGLELERVKNNGVVDLVKWYNWAAFDTIADASFAESFRCLRETEYRYWPISLSKTWKKITYASGLKNIMPLTLFMPVISLIQWILPGSMLQKEVNKLDLVMNRVKSHVDLKQANGKDISSSLIKLNDEKHVLSEAELISNLSLFVFAGTETVATLLPAATYLLTQNIQAMRKLTDAIRIAFPDEQSITVLGLGQIPYLTACINEALRLFPPIPEGLPRVVPPRGDVISGELVPGGVGFDAHSSPTGSKLTPSRRLLCKLATLPPTGQPQTLQSLNALFPNDGWGRKSALQGTSYKPRNHFLSVHEIVLGRRKRLSSNTTCPICC